MEPIRTERFVLEPQTAAHADAMFDVLSDPAIYAFENAPPVSREALRERFVKLESRQSADGREQWLNWVIRLPTSELAGYVQATVRADGTAAVAYELASAYWRRGLAREAVEAMIGELAARYRVHTCDAVLKRDNARSRRLLERLGFATVEHDARHRVDADELLMLRDLGSHG
jgi:RimJ/RimL family protein N-acetyltransferase